jgi:predicted DNA-binding transcriptional regulator AlpA
MSTSGIDLNIIADAVAERLRAFAEQRDGLLDKTAMAQRLGVSTRTISALWAAKELPEPLLHTSGVTRWAWSDVVKFLEARKGRRLRKGRGRYDRSKRREPAVVHGDGGAANAAAVVAE